MHIYRSEHEVIVETDDQIIHVPLRAISVRAELLGYENLVDALDAIVKIAIDGEPDYDPVTLENAWTEAMYALQQREEDRETEVIKASSEDRSTDPRSPLLRSALAAQKDEAMVDNCRKSVRTKFGLPHPKKKLSVMRGAKAKCEAGTECEGESQLCAEDRSTAAECLSELIPDLELGRVEFQHSLTSHAVEPFGLLQTVKSPEITREDILARYAS